MEKHSKWYYKTKGEFYAQGPVTLPFKTSSRRRVKEYLRDEYGETKVSVWPCYESDLDVIAKCPVL